MNKIQNIVIMMIISKLLSFHKSISSCKILSYGGKTLKNKKKICYTLVFVVLFSIATPQVYAKDYVIGEHKIPVTKPDPTSTYVGSEKCKTCHAEIYNGWKTTGHPYKLMTPGEAKAFGLPFPDGYTENDIYMVIGGWGWKSRYMDSNGYIITKTGADRSINGSNQYNIATSKWADYNPGKAMKYECGQCHTTGYSLAGNQDKKPGITGTWEEKGIGCEACHGPASIHITGGGGKGTGILKNNSSALCGNCHTRGGNDTQEVEVGIVGFDMVDGFQEGGVFLKTTVVDGLID